MLGSSAKIICVSHSDVVWKLHGKALSNLTFSKIVDNVYVFIIPSLKDEDFGLYTCYGRDPKDDKYTSFYSYAEIKLEG